MPKLRMPDGQIVAFPDDMPREQIIDMVEQRYGKKEQEQAKIPNAVKWAVNRMAKEGRTEPSLWENIVVGLSGGGQGADVALERALNGATFGARDYFARKRGENPTERIDEIINTAPNDTMAGLAGSASSLADIAGGLPIGAGLYSGASGLASGIRGGRLIGGVSSSGLMGGVRGGFESDFDPNTTAKSARDAMLFDLGLRGTAFGLDKGWSAVQRIKGVPRSLEGAAGTDKGSRVLNRAVRENKDVAKEVYGKAPEALENINRKAIDTVNSVTEKTDIVGNVRSAGKAKGDFIVQNGDKIIVKSPKELGIKNMSSNDRKDVMDAWNLAKGDLVAGEKVGSLKHIDKMNGYLNDKINASLGKSETSPLPQATKTTQRLEALKTRVSENISDRMNNTGLGELNKSYSEAQRVKEAYNAGLKFKPTDVKTRDISYKTPEENSAFVQGVVERATMNPETKNVAENLRQVRGILRKTIGDKADGVFKEVDDLSRAYKNVEKISTTALNKTTAPDPIGKNTGRWIEWFDNPNSPVGGMADFVRRWTTAKSAERAARYLLNPDLPVGQSFGDMIQPLITGISAYLPTKANRKKGE